MYFLVGNAIVDRDDLTIYEKMACVVLARYAGQDAFHDLINLEVLARKMGTGVDQARKAIDLLTQKGMILKENSERIMANAKAVTFETFDEKPEDVPVPEDAPEPERVKAPKRVLEQEVTSEDVMAIFDEVLTKRQALILFELASRNLETLKNAYEVVRETHPFDLVEALSDYLQKKDVPLDTEALFEALEEKPKTQVNLSRIHALYKQQKNLKT